VNKPERDSKGFKIYVESMAKSSEDKAERILSLLRTALENNPGDILDLGAGGGELTRAFLLMAEEFNLKVFALDKDRRMIKILKEKFEGQSKIKIVKADVKNFKLGKKFSAVVCSSILHEIFSERKNVEDVKLILKNIYEHLLPKGVLIIRDGLKPAPTDDIVFLQPLKPELFGRFQKILNHTKTSWLKIYAYHNPKKTKLLMALSRENVYELIVKYQYLEINWPVEMKEKFGFWTKEEARVMLEEIGFNVIHLKSYLLPYFAKMFSCDFRLFEWQDGPACLAEATSGRRRPGAIEIPYPDTHLVIVAKRGL